ncbi:MAG: DUF1003 domain-containing protein [Chloroflexota bacterium]
MAVEGAVRLTTPRMEAQDPWTVGQHLADRAAKGIGSWQFIIVQTGLVIAWCVLNVVGWARHWDPYPFILLNLAFSTQAAYTGPVLLLASNRQAAKDREIAARDDEEIGLLLDLQRQQMHELARLAKVDERLKRIEQKVGT